jgi:transposase-like protein
VGLVRLLSNPSGLIVSHLEPTSDDHNGAGADDRRPQPTRRDARRLNPDEIDELVATYRSGATVPQLVEEFGLHRTTVLAHLERRNVPRRPHVAKLTRDDIGLAADLYKRGQSLAAIGRAFGVNAETIRKGLLQAGVAIRARRGWPPPTKT